MKLCVPYSEGKYLGICCAIGQTEAIFFHFVKFDNHVANLTHIVMTLAYYIDVL